MRSPNIGIKLLNEVRSGVVYRINAHPEVVRMHFLTLEGARKLRRKRIDKTSS
jgi:hypothetical protein